MKKNKNLMVLIACCLVIASSVGILINAAGVFFTPISEELGIGKGSVSMTLTVSNLAYAVGGLFTVRFIHERNFKKMMVLLASVYGASTVIMGFCSNVYLMYVLSLLRGFSAGMAGIVLVTILVNNHFEKNNGLATSIALGCSGIAGALLSPVYTSMIESIGWRMTYIISGVLTFALYLPCILLPIKMNNKVKEVSEEVVVEKKEVKTTKPSYQQQFILICVFAFTIVSVTALSQHFPSMSINAETGALMVSVCMICNTGSKILMGGLADRFGVEKPTYVFGICTLIGLAMLATIDNSLAQLLSAGLIGMVYAIGAVSVVLLSRKVFGDEYNSYYPKISLVGTVSGAIFSSVVGYIYDIFHSYTPAVWMVFIFALIALGCLLKVSKSK